MQTVKSGQTAQITCTAEGDPSEPTPRVRWAFGSNDGPLRGDTIDQSGVLTIAQVNMDHEGEYYCTATPADPQSTVEPATAIARLYVTQGKSVVG